MPEHHPPSRPAAEFDCQGSPLLASNNLSIMQGVEEATKTAPAVVGVTDRVAKATRTAVEATKTAPAVVGVEPSRLVEEATKTVNGAVAGLEDDPRRRDEATIRRAHTLQESHVRTPRIDLPDPCPPTLDLPQAGRLFGIGERNSYELARRGEFPVPVLRLGHQWRVPTRPLLRLLGLLDEPESGETLERTGPIAAAQDHGTRSLA